MYYTSLETRVLFPVMRGCHTLCMWDGAGHSSSQISQSGNSPHCSILLPKISRRKTVALSLPPHSSFFFDAKPPSIIRFSEGSGALLRS